MKKTLLLATLLLTLCAACNKQQPTGTPKLNNAQDSTSWAMGTSIGIALRDCGIPLNNELVAAAVQAVLEGQENPFDDATYKQILDKANDQMAQAQQNKLMDIDKQQQAYFEKLKKENPDIQQAPEGYYYEVVKAGHGPKVQFAQRIKFDYKAAFMFTGEVYDQTYGQHEPIVTNVAEHMFPGLMKGMLLMNEGSTYRFFFPYQLAFGAQGTEDIPPYTPVIYEIQLHEVYPD